MASEQTSKTAYAFVFIALLLLVFSLFVSATPTGVTVATLSNSSAVNTNGTRVNNTGGTGTTAGGYIFKVNFTVVTQNTRWKGYVGNASGKLSLDDSSGFTIYDWSLSSISGEVYTTRQSGTINWGGIKCAYFNTTEEENNLINHTNKADNITATFASTTHEALTVGTVSISANSCPATFIYVNDSSGAAGTFEEVVLYDGLSTFNMTQPIIHSNFSNIVYAQNLETSFNSQWGFDNQSYNFQIIVPEVGLSAWSSSTAYYFYMELS